MKSTAGKRWLSVLAVMIALAHLIPFYILITMSLKKSADFSSKWVFPDYFQLDNFIQSWKLAHLGTAFMNTFIITVSAAILLVFIGSLAAYPLARRETRWNKIVYFFFVSIMVVPPLSALVPLYKLVVDFGMINTRTIEVLNNVAAYLPLTIFLYAGFIRSTIPRELEDAAKIDGANLLSIFYKIVFPLLKPVTATVLIFACIFIWNDYQFAIFFLQDQSVHTLTVALAGFFNANESNLNLVAAAALMAVFPMCILFLVLQKYFIKGLAAGAVKG